MPIKPRVYSYMRFSDAKQAGGASSDRQAAYAAQWAKDHGLVLDSDLSMRDEGLSAFHQKHIKKGALGVFMKAVDDGHVPIDSVLVVEGLDRLSRAEPIQAQAQLTAIISAGIAVVTASDGKIYSRERLRANPMDLVYSLLVMIRAHEESDTKSKRVTDAIRRQCRAWEAGTNRGLIRYGMIPGWVHAVDGKWQIVPERAEAIRLAVDMFVRGLGLGHIVKTLHERDLRISRASSDTSGQLLRMLANPMLIGEKHITLGPEEFVLKDYYPALLERETFDAVQEILNVRTRRKAKGDDHIPSLLTGFGVTFCGYCGTAMKAQNMSSKRRPDGTLADGHRRLQCVRVNHAGGCSVGGSCSSAPIERALMRYCSDMVNLRTLYGSERGVGHRSEVASLQAKLTDLEKKLDRVTSMMLESDDLPAAFIKRARELEVEKSALQTKLRHAERVVAETARTALDGADKQWGALAEGVEALDYAARMQARQLVADTFERIVVYHSGTRPREAEAKVLDVILHAKGGRARMLRIDRKGTLLDHEDIAGA